MTKEEIEKQIEAKKQELAKLEEELKQAEELNPYDWKNKNRFFVNNKGAIYWYSEDSIGCELFNFPDNDKGKKQAEKFAHKLKIQSTILGLKQSLGDEYDHVYVSGGINLCLSWDSEDKKWVMLNACVYNAGEIFFSAKNQALIDYMNKHFPNGWELTSEG